MHGWHKNKLPQNHLSYKDNYGILFECGVFGKKFVSKFRAEACFVAKHVQSTLLFKSLMNIHSN
jgi:hypothetical protein